MAIFSDFVESLSMSLSSAIQFTTVAHIEVNMTLYYCISQLDLEKTVRIEFLPGGNSRRLLVALPRGVKLHLRLFHIRVSSAI